MAINFPDLPADNATHTVGAKTWRYSNTTKQWIASNSTIADFATKAYVDTSVSNLVNAAPATLDTLNELAAALGDDANFSATVTNLITAKAPIASPTFTGTVTAPAFNSTSSIRFKENIAPIDDALSIVNKLQGVTFDWKESRQSDMGVIAEQVNEVIPQFVSKDETGAPQAVEYGKFTSILIEAVKQLAKRVEELENK